MRAWKLLGLAGLAGVAAGGAVLARSERQRRAYTADDVRARLHERAAVLAEQPADALQPAADGSPGRPAPARRLLFVRRRGTGARPR